MNTDLQQSIIRDLVAKGMPVEKARLVLELGAHASDEAFNALMRVSDSAGDNENIEVLLIGTMLLDMRISMVKKELEKFILTLTKVGQL